MIVSKRKMQAVFFGTGWSHRTSYTGIKVTLRGFKRRPKPLFQELSLLGVPQMLASRPFEGILNTKTHPDHFQKILTRFHHIIHLQLFCH